MVFTLASFRVDPFHPIRSGPFLLELITFEILAAERLRLMEFDNRLIIDCFANVVNILIWQFSTNDRFKSEKYESLLGKSIARNELY